MEARTRLAVASWLTRRPPPVPSESQALARPGRTVSGHMFGSPVPSSPLIPGSHTRTQLSLSPVQPACVHSPNLDPHMRTFASLAVPMPGARSAGNRDVRSQVSIHAANPHTSSLYTSNAWSCDLRPPKSPVVQPRRTSHSCDDSVIQGSQLSYLVISLKGLPSSVSRPGDRNVLCADPLADSVGCQDGRAVR